MKTIIGSCNLSNYTQLDYCFDKTTEHSWTGTQVDLVEAIFHLSCEIIAISGNKAWVDKNIEIVIYDVNGRTITKSISLSKFRAIAKEGYSVGWIKNENLPKAQVDLILQIPEIEGQWV